MHELATKMLRAGLLDIYTAGEMEGVVDLEAEVPGIGHTRMEIIQHAIDLVDAAEETMRRYAMLADGSTPNL